MKKLLLLYLVFFPTFAFSQNQFCDCSKALDKDLKDKISQKSYSEFKYWLYEYFMKDSTVRVQLKNESRTKWEGNFSTIIESLPLKSSINADWKTQKDKQTYYHTEQEYHKNQYLTDIQYNEILISKFSDNQLEAYKACLQSCQFQDGVSYLVGGDTNDEFYIKVSFKSTSGGKGITLNGNANYINLEPVRGLVFTDNLFISNGSSLTQYFKRLDVNKLASFSLNVKENVSSVQTPVVIDGKPNTSQVPVGTIVASVLGYEAFLAVNGMNTQNEITDMTKVIWIPCDGRTLTVSKYAKVSGGSVPDLRGVFLRGINDYKVRFPNIPTLAEERRNPSNSNAGEFQDDAFQGHWHTFGGKANSSDNPNFPHNYLVASRAIEDNRPETHTTTIFDNQHYVKNPINDTSNGNPRIASETRPNNVTVYYYLKIN